MEETETEIVLATNTTKVSDEAYLDLNKVTGRKLIWLGPLITVFIIFLGFWINEFKFDYFSIAILVFGLLYPFVLVFFYRRNVKKNLAANRVALGNMELEYRFFETHVDFIANSDTQNATCTQRYADYIKIVETKNFIFFFLHPNNAHIIDKAGFQGNDFEIVKDVLKKHNAKYKYLNIGK